MENFLEELKEYLAKTPKEEIQKQWEKFAECDEDGVSIEEYLAFAAQNKPETGDKDA